MTRGQYNNSESLPIMCGLTAVIKLGRGHNEGGFQVKDGDAKALTDRLEKSLDLIAHRGPDARGTWTNAGGTVGKCHLIPHSINHNLTFAGLGHCRLSIIDLSPAGEQPLHDAENNIHAVVIGEIYDYERLRKQCIDDFGYISRGHSDSELVVALYKHYGAPAFLEHLRGEFAFLIYDDRTEEIFAARDRFGIKPLFWTVVGDEIYIAAEIKAFLGLGWEPEWDVDAIATDACGQGWKTVFKGVSKIQPGNYMTVSAEGEIKHGQYWDIDYPNKHKVETRTIPEMIREVREHIIDAVRLRLRADVPAGIYLSGGIDSSAVAGITKYLIETKGVHLGNQKLEDRVACFCIQFDAKSGLNESGENITTFTCPCHS